MIKKRGEKLPYGLGAVLRNESFPQQTDVTYRWGKQNTATTKTTIVDTMYLPSSVTACMRAVIREGNKKGRERNR